MSIFNAAIYNKQQVLWVFPGLRLPRGKYTIQYLTAGTAIFAISGAWSLGSHTEFWQTLLC